jgi:hypothetical protein
MCRRSHLLPCLLVVLTALAGPAWALEQAHHPSPPDGAVDLSPNADLNWLAGDGTITHHVFLTRDFNDVCNGSLIAWKICQSATGYDPGWLLLGETYYWRIDEVGVCHSAAGQVWSFTVRNSFIVDDMEAYSGRYDYIFDTWLDGAGDMSGVGGNGTGSILELSTDVVYAGSQSMRFAYNNSGQRRRMPYSEAKRTFDAPQDWATTAKALVLRFYGRPDNDIEPMYVAVDDGNVGGVSVYGVLGEDPNDVKKEQWQEWNVDLQDFVNAGADLSNVVSIAIGFGDRDNPEVGGFGVVHFDDIRLYPTRCVPEYGPPADVSGNCIVDLPDVEIMAGEWLESGEVVTDLYPDHVIDFKDYAALANNWSERRMWPAP